METEKLMLVQRELDLLNKHLNASNLSDYNKKRLLTELKSAIVVKDDELPEDVICIESEVELQEINTHQKFKFQIVLPSDANMQMKRVSVFAPVAVAILGYRVGSRVQWEMPNGIKTFEVLKVTRKSESLIESK
mgnify:CR=1 FL=1